MQVSSQQRKSSVLTLPRGLLSSAGGHWHTVVLLMRVGRDKCRHQAIACNSVHMTMGCPEELFGKRADCNWYK